MNDDMSQEALLDRIKQLEEANKKANTEIKSLKRKLPPDEPIVALAEPRTHEFIFELMHNKSVARSMAHIIDGVEFSVGVQREKNKPGMDARFRFLQVRNVDERRKFILATTEVLSYMTADPKRKVRLRTTLIEEPRGSPTVQHYVLCNQKEEIGNWIKSEYEGKKVPHSWTITVSLSVIMQKLESAEPDEDSATAVVVGGKEFRVADGLLSSWSLYFRAYFKHDRKEKKEKRYPVKDSDITVEDFEELLAAIQPTP